MYLVVAESMQRISGVFDRLSSGAEEQELVLATTSMASEDFSFMLQRKPGAYIWLGANGATPSAPLHNPWYDFNDDTLTIGAAYWVALTRLQLSK